MYQQISKGLAESLENKQQVITTAKLRLKCLVRFFHERCSMQAACFQPSLLASSRTASETDLQECRDKEVPMMEEVDVGRVGCCRGGQLALVGEHG